MKIERAAHMGFCYGVKRAVDLALKTAQENNDRHVCTLGELIHNKQVVERLAEKQVTVCESLNDAGDSIVVIRSHGVGPEIYRQAEEFGVSVVDATCPDVKKVQREAESLATEGRTIVIVGDSEHPEVQSIMKWAGATPVVINSVVQLDVLRDKSRIGVVAQTTFIGSEFDDIVDAIKKIVSDVVVRKTTCLATNKRQQSAVDLAKRAQVMLVIGGKHSANTRHLAMMCEQYCANTHHIETSAELSAVWFSGVQNVGVTAGASTPDWIIEGVIEKVEEFSMLDSLNQSIRVLKAGELINAVVVAVQMDCAFVDVGFKGEVVLYPADLTWPAPDDCRKVVARGDELTLLVLSTDGPDGVKLSKVKADEIVAWKAIELACEQGAVISANCIEVVKGGLVTTVHGLRGFMPASQTDIRFVDDLAAMVGKHVHVKVIECDRERRKIVLSRRVVLQAEHDIQVNNFYEKLTVGEIIDGTVARVADFGVFVKIGPVDGLVPLRELSWIKVKHPSELLKPGDAVRVIVQKIDRESNRISLSIKDLQIDPWHEDIKAFREEDVIEVGVLRAQKAGIVVELAAHLEGFIPRSELPVEVKNSEIETSYPTGARIRAKIVRIDETVKRIILSQKRMHEDAEQAEVDNYIGSIEHEPVATIGDKFAGLLNKIKLKD